MTRKEILGQLGENLVAELLNGTLSEDKYDDVKDMVLEDGTHVEVKTQARWSVKNCFTMDETYTGRNLQKCLEVDRLIFVEPGRNDIIRVYECHDRRYSLSNPRGKETYCFPVDKMDLLYEITDHDLCEEMIANCGTARQWLT